MTLFKKETGEQIEITVQDMVCGHCEMHVRDTINKVEGVKKSKVSNKE